MHQILTCIKPGFKGAATKATNQMNNFIKDFIQQKNDERNKIDKKRAVTALTEIMPLNTTKNADIQAYLAHERQLHF